MTNLRSYVVLRRLTISAPVLTPRSVRADYTVQHRDGSTVSNTLSFTYDHDFFDPDSEADQNLASMMTAQVAVNYGLFFGEIIFEGRFDSADVRFLDDMMENTAREIYVNKLLFPNEFIKEEYRLREAEKVKSYSASIVLFTQRIKPVKKREVIMHPGRYAILSSGGKDSLLTYGLVKEFGEAHPVFINEAGRHWFTAVNAYRHFNETEPNTVKPWCNSDRMFNWMLRQMPFIREDYANVRADIYPIRLWTVPVFLWGVLPVVLKRNIGNILIGDEYDSTMRGRYRGILHFYALFDQSKYFDNYVTRYYHKKGWAINQFSLLRSLSELLILKVLVKRYPDLQKHQVSCHAAHEKDGRMYPCGNCEKCRRIIGMLMALDEDPGRCGYSPGQVRKGLSALEVKSVKQIGSDAAHLYHILLSKGLIASNEHTRQLAIPHPEILMLRFDKQRSNLADLPQYVRLPLFKILAEYADGAVVFSDRKWHPIKADEQYLSGPDFHLNSNNYDAH